MKSKPLVPRSSAIQDVDEALAYYLCEGGAELGLAFIEALERTYRNIGSHPEAGSPKYAEILTLPGLWMRPLVRFPHLVFYLEKADHIDVWRILHGKRDIPAWLHQA